MLVHGLAELELDLGDAPALAALAADDVGDLLLLVGEDRARGDAEVDPLGAVRRVLAGRGGRR